MGTAALGQRAQLPLDVNDPSPKSPGRQVQRNRTSPSFWGAYYRDQARLIWEWRAARMSLIRRALLSYLAAMGALLIVATVSPDLTLDGPRALL